MDVIAVRSFAQADFGYVVRRWHETNLASYPYSPEHQRHSLHDASVYFRDRVLPECDVWIAEAGAAAAGLMAIAPPWIRHLAVFPEHQRGGIGTALLRRARELSPQELRLSTFQRNLPARAFYEHHRFVAFGSSPPPENEPDVEYRWTA